MQNGSATVYVIDPESQVQNAIYDLVSAMGLHCITCATGHEFFAEYDASESGCVVLEVKLPDMSGLQIQRQLQADGMRPPLVYLSAQTDISLAVELFRRGAVHYLQKPLQPLELIGAVLEALAVDKSHREAVRQQQEVAEAIAVLTAKERRMLRLIADGQSNVEIASELKISLRTVTLYRTQVARKLRIASPNGLIRFALLANQNDGQSMCPQLSM